MSSSRTIRRSRSRFGLFLRAAAVRAVAALRAWLTVGERGAGAGAAAVLETRGATCFGAFFAVVFAAFLEVFRVSVRAPAPLDALAAGLADFFADFLAVDFRAFAFTDFFADRFADLFTAFFNALAPFALRARFFDAFALFFDAFDLAISEPLRPSTAAEDARSVTAGRPCLDRLS
jgi:hypothetical protein